MSNSNAIFSVVKAVPIGSVATYGQVARLAGLPGAARLVGTTLSRLPPGTQLPWHRVINSQGRISLPPGSGGYVEQIARLTAEGVQVNNGRVALSRFLWRPDSE